MQVSDALSCLGSKRVIWIDDCFNDTPAQLVRLLFNSLELSKACGFDELLPAFEAYAFDPSEAEAQAMQVLADAKKERIAAIKAEFFKKEGEQKGFKTGELSATAIERACTLLGVGATDRWTFDKADRHLFALCAGGDSDVAYVIDLNEAGGMKTRGLDIIRLLWNNKSSGTTFILTHETNIGGEGEKEIELRKALAESGTGELGISVCVIAKERLYDNPANATAVEEALKIAIKRAGLRRCVHDVLTRARGETDKAFKDAAVKLLSIPPEQLEAHVFERGYKEGVSELHVIERALTARMAQHLRNFFGADKEIRDSTNRLRALRNIDVKLPRVLPNANLASFREAEVWESDALVNNAFAPIACGDVFETDPSEVVTKKGSTKFILLAQPCDISLRPDEKKRALDTGFIVPLKRRTVPSRGDPKLPYLPFTLNGEQWACDFRKAAVVKLAILDLASFRSDGRVRVDDGHKLPTSLLVAQQNVYADRTAPATRALAAAVSIVDERGAFNPSFQLCFTNDEAFEHVHCATFEAESRIKSYGKTTIHPKRVTWRLRRFGRIRMPYAAALLDEFVAVMRRHAFDMDYITPGFEENLQTSEANVGKG